MSNRADKVPVSERALLQRLNRKLAHEGERIRVNRSERWSSDLGYYYCVNDRNCITAAHITLEKWGRELGVLAAWEVLAS